MSDHKKMKRIKTQAQKSRELAIRRENRRKKRARIEMFNTLWPVPKHIKAINGI